MRAAPALFVVSASLFLSAATVATQDNKKAEEVYKNIQSFKGEPADSILPAMEFMSRSLNVECDFCHVQDRSSDEKETKAIARKMIAMTRDINAKNFGGRTQVTCATCHAGHGIPVSVPPVVGTGLRPDPAPDETPEKVLAAYDAAVGSQADVRAIRALRMRGESGTGKDAAKVVSTIELPSKFVSVTVGAQGEQIWGSNGAQVWWKSARGVIPMPPEVAPQLTRFDKVYLGSTSLPTLARAAVLKVNLDGRDEWILRGTAPGNNRMVLFFDAKTGLLTRVGYFTPTILGSMEDTYDYSDYKRIHGVMIPTTITQHVTGRDTTRHFSHVDINPIVNTAEFETPAK